MDDTPVHHLMRRLTAMVATLILVVGCSSASDDQPRADGTDAPAGTTVASAESTVVSTGNDDVAGRTMNWQRIDAPHPCACSDGSEFHYWVRRADPDKVLFYLNGGGACFSKETCFTDPSFKADLGDDQPISEGIFSATNADNPLADYSIVAVPYCTGDLHLGTVIHDYGTTEDPAPVRHVGSINATNALTTAAALFPDATKVVVAGSSAGAAGSPVYAGLASDLFPEAAIVNLADAAGGYPDNPAVTRAIGTLWGITAAIPNWPGAPDVDSPAWSLPGMSIESAKHAPGIHFVRIDHADDEVQEQFNELAALTDDPLIASITANENAIRDSGARLSVWVSDGTDHTILDRDDFYRAEIDGTRLTDWITKILDGEAVEDERCATCKS